MSGSSLSPEVLMKSRLLLMAAVLTLSGCLPLGPIPGGALSGDVAPPPGDWTEQNAVGTIQLETRPDDPYSVNLWGVGVGRSYYVGSGGGGESTWVEHISADPNVRLRIGGAIYELRAVRTEDPAELAPVRQSYMEKYDVDQAAEEWDAAWFYRLEPR
jgi:hypothetical protein